MVLFYENTKRKKRKRGGWDMNYFTLIISVIGISGFIIFREEFTVFGIVCFLAIIFEDALTSRKINKEVGI